MQICYNSLLKVHSEWWTPKQEKKSSTASLIPGTRIPILYDWQSTLNTVRWLLLLWNLTRGRVKHLYWLLCSFLLINWFLSVCMSISTLVWISSALQLHDLWWTLKLLVTYQIYTDKDQPLHGLKSLSNIKILNWAYLCWTHSLILMIVKFSGYGLSILGVYKH